MSYTSKTDWILQRDRRALRLMVVLAFFGATGAAGKTGDIPDPGRERIARVGVPFIESCGPLPSWLAFSASTPSGGVAVARDGALSYSLAGSALIETFVAG